VIPLGIRSNNPGNIERSNLRPWKGEIPSTGRFCVFKDMAHGVRAAACVLTSYYRNKKIDPPIRTIRQAINRWAPMHENQTTRYAANVAEWSGLPADQPIDLSCGPALEKILPAMFRQENGTNNGKPWVDQATIVQGVKMAVEDRK